MLRIPGLAIAALALLLAPAAVGAAPPLPQVEVTSCGQVVPKKTVGYLSADLDCSSFTGGPATVYENDQNAAVYLSKKSQLDLRGFTLTVGRNGVLCDAVSCAPNKCPKGACAVFNGTIEGSALTSRGIGGEQPVVHDVTVTGCSIGVYGERKLRLDNATIQDSALYGVAGGGLRISNTGITNSGQFGVAAWTDRGPAARLAGSTIAGSGTASFCPTSKCADIYAVELPRLQTTTCNTSIVAFVPGGTWGVCALD